jgi:tetratricopeptide (TPR) repeat protein
MAQLGSDRAALSDLAAAVEVGESELDRFQQFLDLIDRAHAADLTFPEAEVGDGLQRHAQTLPTASMRGRHSEAQVPLLLQALKQFDVLGRDDWNTTLGGGVLGWKQVEQIRRTVYEELLRLALATLILNKQERARQGLSPQAAARQALVYLAKAENGHQPTQGFYALRARCRKALGEEAAAEVDCQLADRTAPTLAVDHILRGRAALDAKQFPQAVRAMEAAVDLEPTNFWSLMWLGFCLCDLGQGPEDFAAAAGVFTGCIHERPDHPHPYYSRAIAYDRLRRFDKALTDFSKAIELIDPSKDAFAVAAWNWRGAIYCDFAQYDRALADFSKAIELDAKFAVAWHNRGGAYRKLGQPAKAVADVSRAIELEPKDAKWWLHRGVIYCDHLGQYDKAVADFSKAIELDASLADAWHDRGIAYLKQGHPNKAIGDLSKAVGLNPKHAMAFNNLAWTLATCPELKIRDSRRAVELAERAVLLEPKGSMNTLGVAHYRAGDWKAAIAALKKSVELDQRPATSFNAFFLAMAHWQIGEKEQARSWYDQGVHWMQKNAPNDEELRRFRAEAEELLEINDKDTEDPMQKP